jgi:hypothetical protein
LDGFGSNNNQHIIPQFFLRKFQGKRGTNDIIWVIDKFSGIARYQPVGEVGARYGYAGQMIRYSVQPNKLGDRNWGECQPKHERILIHPTGPTIRLTLVHEIGHALDHGLGIAFGLGDDHFASSSDPSFKALNNAIEASRRIETIRDYKSRYPPGTVGHDSAQIYLTPEECFARAFTQWVVRTSNDECLSCQLEEKIEHPDSIPIHWDADDFDPIVHLVDALL